MSFRQLAALPVSKGCSGGAKPRMDWLPIAELVIDDTYQRDISKQGLKTIGAIAEEFEWSKFSPVIVCPAGNDRFAIIDGQHRATAALSCGFDTVPCYIVYASPKDAAGIFSAVNGRVTPLSPLALYKGALAAGDSWAVSIKRACASAGIEALRYPVPSSRQKPFQTMAIGTMRNVITRHGEEVLTAALRFLAAFADMAAPGAIGSGPILRCQQFFTAAPVRLKHLDSALKLASGRNLMTSDDGEIASLFAKAAGSKTISDDVIEQVLDLADRRHTAGQIAAKLRIPYSKVDAILKEAASA